MEDITKKFADKNFDLTHFNKVLKRVSKTTERPYNRYGFDIPHYVDSYSYSLDDVLNAVNNLNIVEMRKISRYFYNTKTSYRRIVDTFAQVYKYYYVVDLRHASDQKNKKTLLRIYNDTLDYLDAFNIRDVFGYISKRVLVDGAFYGYINNFENNRVTITQLDPDYCRSRDTSAYGTAMVEFNVQFFLQYEQNEEDLRNTLKAFPAEVRRYWEAYRGLSRKRSNVSPWVRLPAESSCAFFMDASSSGFGMGGVPVIFDTLKDVINFNDYKDIEKKRDTAELQKLLVQQFKLDEDGDLDVLMEEMAGLHEAVSSMLADHDSIDVMTTLADTVDLKDAQSSTNQSGTTNIEKMLIPKYENSGLSAELFYATGATTLEYCVNNFTSFMSQLIDKYSTWLSMVCYSHINYGKVIPIVTILPVTWYNQSKMADMYLKNAQYGFSWILPYVASGKKQSTLLDNAYMEQEVLKLSDVMRPLSSSFTQTDDGDNGDGNNKTTTQAKKPEGDPGRPELAQEDKSPKTIANINAMH